MYNGVRQVNDERCLRTCSAIHSLAVRSLCAPRLVTVNKRRSPINNVICLTHSFSFLCRRGGEHSEKEKAAKKVLDEEYKSLGPMRLSLSCLFTYPPIYLVTSVPVSQSETHLFIDLVCKMSHRRSLVLLYLFIHNHGHYFTNCVTVTSTLVKSSNQMNSFSPVTCYMYCMSMLVFVHCH